MTVRCVVFDIDDTLYLERDYVKSGFAAVGQFVLDEYRVEEFGAVAIGLFERGVRGNTFDLALAEMGLPTSDAARLVEVYRQHLPQVALLPDAAECLAALHGRVSLAVVTDGPLASQQNEATALRLAQWCSPIVFTAGLGPDRGKPHPEAFSSIERQLGCQGRECVYVADNPIKDFQGPQMRSWRTIRIRRPLGLHFDRESPPGIDAELSDMASLATLITSWDEPPT